MMFVARNQDAFEPFRRAPRRRAVAEGQVEPEVVLDLSRLLSRILHPSPTGVDRVELAYARTLRRLIPDRLLFGAVHPTGLYGRLPAAEVERFLDATEARWEREGWHEQRVQTYVHSLAQCWALRPRPVCAPSRPRVLLQASPHHLHQPRVVAGKLARERARFVCLVHDLIPISHPEYARPNGQMLHRRRISTLATHADGLITNSRATLESLIARAGPALAHRPLRVAHLGIDTCAAPDARRTTPDTGYFVCVSTIEPRKNHLLLLNLWRSIVEALGPDQSPRLLLVGRRGWENENILDMLDRCELLRGVVHEFPRLPDQHLRPLLRDARAVLMPSFAEGFGLPVAEALAAGVPVLASDLPAHREAGGPVPEYFDPLDGVAWRSAVLDYFAPASERRRAQLARLASWRPATWDEHIETALALVEEVACAEG
ncbi:glycosyltransferase family 1 protein [Sphingomonas sp. H39-1-10]|uniref:glycosyltransferase family 4 protein n=1 Tax=Sphingomonas pollutisoli TaxID=3030829 RepID=UPI0023B92ED7|nr:glycosyltransferase family 1 protein [Sphingomonas pollutisoli]MDF0490483.1 glycosyltransferase family 1 protein [Sphingomonas pollutisoli]